MDLLSSAEFTTLLFVAVLLQGFALILGRVRGSPDELGSRPRARGPEGETPAVSIMSR